MLLTSVPVDAMTAEEVLQTYRLRWQVELAFKRLKSGMGIHKLPARDERLARSWLSRFFAALESLRHPFAHDWLLTQWVAVEQWRGYRSNNACPVLLLCNVLSMDRKFLIPPIRTRLE